MNEILVAVDFSKSSVNALAHAIGLASRFKSRMIWVWVENKNSIRHLAISDKEDLSKTVERKFSDLKDTFKNDIDLHLITTIAIKGATTKAILKISSERMVDFIVIGTHGSQGFRKLLMGNNARNIITGAKCPVLSIRLHRDLKRELKRIILPIDSSLDTRQKLPITTKIALAYNAEVHLLGLYFSSIESLRQRVNNYIEQTEKYLLKSGVTKIVTHLTTSKSGARTIINYAMKVDAGLISTMLDTENLTSDIWLGSQAQQLVNQSPIPILSITNKNLLRTRPIF